MSFNYQQPGYNYAADNLQFYQQQGVTSPRGVQGAMQTGYSDYGGNLSGTMVDTQLSQGFLALFSTSGYPGEPPLLEELGINFHHIKLKTISVLSFNSKRLLSNPDILNDSDLAGPILFGVLIGALLLFNGKFHFSYIYGVALVGIVSLHQLFKLMGNDDANTSVDVIKTGSVVGYCLLPLVFLSALNILLNLNNLLGYVITALAIFWCTFSASAFFMIAFKLSNVRFLIAYPLAILYSIFALMIIF